MFWKIMLAVDLTVWITYGVLGRWGGRLGIGDARRRIGRHSSVLALGLVFVSIGNLYLRREL